MLRKKRIEEVELTEDDENRIRETLLKINEIIRGKKSLQRLRNYLIAKNVHIMNFVMQGRGINMGRDYYIFF